MSKTKVSNPAMEGSVSRAVDFNLKKEDLMLLILEGRKEVMEDEIGKLQTTSTNLNKELVEAQEKFKKRVEKSFLKTLNAESKRILSSISKESTDSPDDVTPEGFKLSLQSTTDDFSYTRFEARPIGDGKGSTYIKEQRQTGITRRLYTGGKISVMFSLNGKVFANKSDLFARKDGVRSCNEYGKEFVIIDESFDREYQKTFPEWKKLSDVAENLAKIDNLLSDILAEYDLFNRNQPRAKAKMIKEVLSRDEAGQALLGNIMAAANGVKLLAIEGPKS
jgi:hypothetical protein